MSSLGMGGDINMVQSEPICDCLLSAQRSSMIDGYNNGLRSSVLSLLGVTCCSKRAEDKL